MTQTQVRSGNWNGLRNAATVVGVVAILYLARETFIPLAFATTLALILSAPVRWLSKHGLHRVPAALLVMTLAIMGAAGVGYVIFNQFVQVVNELPTYRDTITSKIRDIKKPTTGSIGRAAENVKELGKELESARQSSPTGASPRSRQSPVQVQMVETPPDILTYLRDLAQPFIAPLAMLLIVLVFTLFLLVEESDLRNRLLRLAGVGRLNLMTQALEDATSRVSRYLLLQFLVNAAFGLLTGIGLFLIGVPYAALWGAVAALFRIVPYVGSFVSGLLPIVLCLAVFDGWRQPVSVFFLFGTLELVTGNFLEPWLYGSHTGISSLALLLTTIFWATLWGPAGLILSTPLTVCVVVLGRHMKQLSFLHILLGDEPVLAPHAQLYQRLLAMDDHEARAVAEEVRREKSTLHLYDDVILPAIAMAEHDRHKGALTVEREEFFILSIREMLAEHSEQSEARAIQPDTGRILCVPAHDDADELAAAMLSQLLEQGTRASITFPLGELSYEMLELIQPADNDVFCISSVPPFAFSHARDISRQLRQRFPKTKIVMGVWGFSGDRKLALKRFLPLVPDQLVTSLAEAIQFFNPEGEKASTEVGNAVQGAPDAPDHPLSAVKLPAETK